MAAFMNTSVLRYHEVAAFRINTAYNRDTKTLKRFLEHGGQKHSRPETLHPET